MRKVWYASAVFAGGMLLFGASPARADLLPQTGTAEQQADERLADLLGQSNGINMSNPLRYSTLGRTPLGENPVMQFRSGQNSPDLNPVLPGRDRGEARPELPAADVVGGALRRPAAVGSPVRQLSAGDLQFNRLLGELFRGLRPDGVTPGALRRPTAGQLEKFDGGMPLLGGLGGLLPVNDLPRHAPAGPEPDTSGLPAGGLTVLPGANTSAVGVPPTAGQAAQPAQPGQPNQADQPGQQPPAQHQPAQAAKPGRDKPMPDATPDDPRLHEEPVEDEASPHRPFSPDGRPVAGFDQDYK